MAVGTCTLTHYTLGNVRRINFSVVASSSDGSVPATVLPSFQGRLLALHTNPGAVAPTDNYDITLIDGDGMDRLQGAGVDRDTSVSEQVPILYEYGIAPNTNPPVSSDETLTLTFAGNSVNSAIIVGNLYYELGGR